MKIEIAPSILAANLLDLGNQIKQIEDLINLLHFDIMDGHFVENITFGSCILNPLRKISKLKFDVHLMIENPEKFIEKIADVSDIISFHYEAVKSKDLIIDIIKQIKNLDKSAGLAINPDTDCELIKDFLDIVDQVVVMGVYPGKCGQKFIRSTIKKIEFLRKKNEKLDIEVDGGVNLENAKEIVSVGANILVSGSFVFQNKNPREAILKLNEVINSN